MSITMTVVAMSMTCCCLYQLLVQSDWSFDSCHITYLLCHVTGSRNLFPTSLSLPHISGHRCCFVLAPFSAVLATVNNSGETIWMKRGEVKHIVHMQCPQDITNDYKC